jgi:hypothetical protein
MSRTFAVAAFLVALTPIALQAATSQATKKFSVSLTYDKGIAWYETNRSGVLKASNCLVLKDHGKGQYTVQTNTPVGACQYVLKETREQGKDKKGRRITIYRFKFVRNISGRVANQEVHIAVTEVGEKKCEVNMWMTTTVAGRFVPVFAVSNVQQNCLAGSEAFFTKYAR